MWVCVVGGFCCLCGMVVLGVWFVFGVCGCCIVEFVCIDGCCCYVRFDVVYVVGFVV